MDCLAMLGSDLPAPEAEGKVRPLRHDAAADAGGLEPHLLDDAFDGRPELTSKVVMGSRIHRLRR